ncbi:related to Type 2A phosphatase activator TIP41 [Nakaseomyces glabratus]|nr:TIP41-like family [Nakaseomyces glabratus]QNG15628.1 uncharacterized protein GWK60_K05269 [Nakaseomyces glabratus]SCV14216.1 related to Type 2A phosphatase activator TIP41 [Nakaseomyces glabratus]SLM12769.1 related to Type 2A phosphatase activator TIP41 [Nakaseomyces glabratus]
MSASDPSLPNGAKKPNRPGAERGPGINAIQINAAREMHAMSIRGRNPRNANTTSGSSILTRTTIPVEASHTSTFATPSAPDTTINKSPKKKNDIPHHVCNNNPNNPNCPHCGTVIIPSPRATLPLKDSPSITVADTWKVTTQKRPILNSQELDDWEANKLQKLPLPEMIFGNNFVRIDNVKNGWYIEFNALDALRQVNLEDTGLRVAHSKVWMQSKQKQQQQQQQQQQEKTSSSESSSANPLEIAHPYDWTYTTLYKGTTPTDAKLPKFEEDIGAELPIDKLSRPDKILFFDDMILFEDELADNGISVLNVKIRVMHERLLLLSRFFLRVDDVLVRVIDTRVYVDFTDNIVIREFKKHECHYNELLAKHQRSNKKTLHDPKAALRDSNWVVEHTPLIERKAEIIHF